MRWVAADAAGPEGAAAGRDEGAETGVGDQAPVPQRPAGLRVGAARAAGVGSGGSGDKGPEPKCRLMLVM